MEIKDSLPKINIGWMDRKYTFASGTLMFTSKKRDGDIGVDRDDVYNFMETFKKKFPNFLYHAIRENGDRIHLDFCYAVDRGETQQEKLDNFKNFYEKNFKNDLYKSFGSALFGYDVSFGARGVYINSDLINSKQSE